MKSVVRNTHDEWFPVDGKQIDANFAEHEGKIAELGGRWEAILYNQKTIQARLAALEAAKRGDDKFPRPVLSSSGQSFIAYSDAVKLEKDVRTSERQRAAGIVNKVLAPVPAYNSIRRQIVPAILDGAEAEKQTQEDIRDEYLALKTPHAKPEKTYTQADLDAAVMAAIERAAAWVRWYDNSWDQMAFNECFQHILNNDEVPK